MIVTKAMVPVDGPVRTGVGLLGSPRSPIPRSVQRDGRFDHLTRPDVLRRRLAAKTRHNRVTIALHLFVLWLLSFFWIAAALAAADLYYLLGTPALTCAVLVVLGLTTNVLVLVERASTAFRLDADAFLMKGEEVAPGTRWREIQPRRRDPRSRRARPPATVTPNAGYFVQGGYGDDESETGPAGSDSVGRVLVEELAATGVTAELTAFDGGSDFDAFVEAGIPTGGVYTGDEGVKTSEQADRWGGQAGAVFDPCYHAACDRADGIHRGALDDFSDAIAGTVTRFAVSTDAINR